MDIEQIRKDFELDNKDFIQRCVSGKELVNGCYVNGDLHRMFIGYLDAARRYTKPAAPVVWPEPDLLQYESRDGDWKGFMNKGHEINTIESGEWNIRGLYTKATVQTMLKAQRGKT